MLVQSYYKTAPKADELTDLLLGASDGNANTSILDDLINDESFVWYYPQSYRAPIELFFACNTQWRVGMAGAIGLDYVAVETVIRRLRLKISPEQFRLFQVMEAEALKMMAN